MTDNKNGINRIPYLKPNARFVANGIKVLDCFKGGESIGLTCANIVGVSGVSPRSTRSYLAVGVALGLVVRDAVTLEYYLTDISPTHESFVRAMAASDAPASLVKALWVLSCFADDETKSPQSIAATTGLSLEAVKSYLAALISAGYLTRIPTLRKLPQRYECTPKVRLRPRPWAALVLTPTGVAAAA